MCGLQTARLESATAVQVGNTVPKMDLSMWLEQHLLH